MTVFNTPIALRIYTAHNPIRECGKLTVTRSQKRLEHLTADPYDRTVAAGRAAVDIFERGHRAARAQAQGLDWLERISETLSALPEDWRDLMAAIEPQ